MPVVIFFWIVWNALSSPFQLSKYINRIKVQPKPHLLCLWISSALVPLLWTTTAQGSNSTIEHWTTHSFVPLAAVSWLSVSPPQLYSINFLKVKTMLHISVFSDPPQGLCWWLQSNAPSEHSGWLIVKWLKYLLLVRNFLNSIDDNLPMPQRNSPAWITIISLGNYGLLPFLKPGLEYKHCCYVRIN